MSARPISVTIVVATYNRRDELLVLLKSIENELARPDVELHILDDGSTDSTGQAVSHLEKVMGQRFRYTMLDHSGPSRARNRGIKESRAEVCVFVDTDCQTPKGWLSALTEPLLNDSKAGATGGPDRSEPGDSTLARAIDYLMTAFLTTGGVRGGTKRAATYHPRSFNMAVKTDAALKAGGFPNIWYGEDIIFSHRVRQAGHELLYVDDAWLYHKRRTSVTGFAKQVFRMGRARLMMGRYDTRLLEPVYLVPLVEIAVAACLILTAIVSPSIPVWSMAAAAVFISYLAAITIDSLRRLKSLGSALLVPMLFCLREACYGLGSIAGLAASTSPLRATGGISGDS